MLQPYTIRRRKHACTEIKSRSNTHTDIHTHTQTHTSTDTRAYPLMDTKTHKDIETHTNTNMYKCAPHKHTYGHANTHAHPRSHACTHIPPPPHTDTHTHTDTQISTGGKKRLTILSKIFSLYHAHEQKILFQKNKACFG